MFSQVFFCEIFERNLIEMRQNNQEMRLPLEENPTFSHELLTVKTTNSLALARHGMLTTTSRGVKGTENRLSHDISLK